MASVLRHCWTAADEMHSYVLLHPNFRPSVSLIPSPTLELQRVSNLSATYHIPATRTTLHLDLLAQPVEYQLLKRVLTRMSAQLREYMNAHGDGWLLPEDDPYTVSLPGCTFFAKSNPNPTHGRQQHLTYGILSSVAAGLWQWMIIGDRVREVRFEIEDSSWGIVGIGVIASYDNDGH